MVNISNDGAVTMKAIELDKILNNKKEFPSKKWKALRGFILQEIEKINLSTTWTESEPEWWLDMTWTKSEMLRRAEILRRP